MQFETVKTSLIQLNSALCMKLLTQTHKPQVFISIYHTYLAKIHGLTTSASSMKCVVKTTTRPSRAARMMFHVALRLYGSIPVHCRNSFDIFRYQNQVADLPQRWSAKNWNSIGRISFGCFIYISCVWNLNITMKSNWSPTFSQLRSHTIPAWSRLIQEDHRRFPNQCEAKRKLPLLPTGQSSYKNGPIWSRTVRVIWQRSHRHHNCRICPARVCAFSVKPTCSIISLQRLVTCRF